MSDQLSGEYKPKIVSLWVQFVGNEFISLHHRRDYRVNLYFSPQPYYLSSPNHYFRVRLNEVLLLVTEETGLLVDPYFKSNFSYDGFHIYVNDSNHLFVVYTGFKVETRCRFMNSPAQINSFFPRFHHKDPNGFLIGLAFTWDLDKGVRECNRHKLLVEDGGVFHITATNLRQLYGAKINLPEYFGIYVCEGARLIVIEETYGATAHTRTLLQAGSFVFVHSKLMLMFSEENVLGQNQCLMGYSMEQMIRNRYLPNNFRKIKHPILFLKKIPSHDSSLVWGLSTGNIRRATTDITCLPHLLNIPPNAQFEAIEEWDDGIREVQVRHEIFKPWQESLSFTFGIPNEFKRQPLERNFDYTDVIRKIETNRPIDIRRPIGQQNIGRGPEIIRQPIAETFQISEPPSNVVMISDIATLALPEANYSKMDYSTYPLQRYPNVTQPVYSDVVHLIEFVPLRPNEPIDRQTQYVYDCYDRVCRINPCVGQKSLLYYSDIIKTE